jgi:glycosyltransferase involved in cell wall biosynthesis
VNNSDVTVVIPSRSRPSFLARTLSSVQAQVGGSPHIIVVDDASDFPVPSFDGVDVVRHAAPLGAAAARNRGIADVRTEWIAFCDDDDLWAPTKLASQCSRMTDCPDAGWSYTGAVEVDVDLAVLGGQRALESGWIEQQLLGANIVAGGGSTVLVRTDLVQAAGGFAEKLHAAEDWDLWIRLARLAQVVAVDEPLVAWRRHGENKSAHWSLQSLADLDERLGARARELGVPFEHEYAAQSAIDRAVDDADFRAAARDYWSRFRRRHDWKDAISAASALAVPNFFVRAKRRQHRRSVPAVWESKLGWLGTGDASRRAPSLGL